MASIRPRQSGGRTVYNLRWRENGTQRTATFDTKAAAKRWQKVVELTGTLPSPAPAPAPEPAPAAVTVGDAIKAHIAHLTGITDRTRSDYTRIAKAWDSIKDTPVAALTRDQIAVIVNADKRSGKTIRNAHSVLSAALAWAVEAGHAPKNVAFGLRMPRVDTTEIVPMTKGDYRRLMAAIPAHYRPLFEFLALTGARLGEASALTVADVNFDSGLVSINKAVKRDDENRLYVGLPKTARSRRHVSMPQELRSTLKALCDGADPDALVFTTVQGRMLHPNNLNERVWKPTVEAAEISVRPRIHDLRHMHASWLISRGVDLLIVQRRLGHESIVTTADRYGHLIPGAQDAATNALDRLLAEDDDTESPAA